MNDEKHAADQSGGVNISGGAVTVGGDVIGRDKIVGTEISNVRLDQIFPPHRRSGPHSPARESTRGDAETGRA